MRLSTQEALAKVVQDAKYAKRPENPPVSIDVLRATIAEIEQELEKMRTHRDHLPEMRTRGNE